MSVIIRGMKFPKDGCVDIRIWGNGAVEILRGHNRFIVDGAKAIELPAQHGRLIDGDVAEVITYTNESGDFADGILYAADWIADQPTIIEAEGE